MITPEKFETVPNAILKDVTADPNSETKPITPNSENSLLSGAVSDADVLAGKKHTEISTLSTSDNAKAPDGIGNVGNASQASGTSVSIGSMIEGKLALEMIDSAIPALLIAAMYALGVSLRKTELQLTEKEKATLAPIMQACLNTLMLNFNSPWQTLAVTMGIMYGSKVGEKGLIAYMDKMNEKKEREALNPKKTEPKNDLSNQSANVVSKVVQMNKANTAPQKFEPTEFQIKAHMKKTKKSSAWCKEDLIKKHNLKYGIPN